MSEREKWQALGMDFERSCPSSFDGYACSGCLRHVGFHANPIGLMWNDEDGVGYRAWFKGPRRRYGIDLERPVPNRSQWAWDADGRPVEGA